MRIPTHDDQVPLMMVSLSVAGAPGTSQAGHHILVAGQRQSPRRLGDSEVSSQAAAPALPSDSDLNSDSVSDSVSEQSLPVRGPTLPVKP